MLPAAHRLTDSTSFRSTVRSGRRAGSTTLVVHLASAPAGSADDEGGGVEVGFVVSKAVGNAVVRNRVKRRLRQLTREHLPTLQALPGSVVLVVRALPSAGTATSSELASDLARCIRRVIA